MFIPPRSASWYARPYLPIVKIRVRSLGLNYVVKERERAGKAEKVVGK